MMDGTTPTANPGDKKTCRTNNLGCEVDIGGIPFTLTWEVSVFVKGIGFGIAALGLLLGPSAHAAFDAGDRVLIQLPVQGARIALNPQPEPPNKPQKIKNTNTNPKMPQTPPPVKPPPK